MDNKPSRGSEWRKWDLHLHSPFTWLDNKYKHNNEGIIGDDEISQFIDTIVNSGLSVIGLTNYFKFDDKDFEIKKRLEEKGITTFLNLEVRLSNVNKAGQMIDYHIIFDNQLPDIDIKNFLASSKAKIGSSEVAFNQLTHDDIEHRASINLDKLLEKLSEDGSGLRGKYLKGFLSRGHGNATSESDKKTHTVYEEITRKSDLILHSSDNEDNLIGDRKYWLKESPYIRPLLQSSDAHALNEIGEKFTWIKADTTFEGLRQIIFEPENRVGISIEKPELKRPYLVIDHVEFSQLNATDTTKIFFNPNLNTVIGGRSNGKSTLTNSIAQQLNHELFTPKDPTTGLGMYTFNNANFNIYWQDGAGVNNDRKIEFIPQDYMIRVAEKDEDRNKLIRSTVETDESNYQKIINFEQSVQENFSAIRQLLEELEIINNQLENLKEPEGDKAGIEKQLKKIDEAIKEQSEKINFSADEQKKYRETIDILRYQINRKRLAESNLKSLEFIRANSISLKIPISETDDSQYNKKVSDILITLEQEVNQKWQEELISIDTEQNKQLIVAQEAIDKIITSADYLKGQANIKNNKELEILSNQQKIESEQLASFTKFQSEKSKLDDKKVAKQNEIRDVYSNFKKYRNQLERTFKAKPADGKIEIAISFSNIPFESEIHYLRGRNAENDKFISEFDKDPDAVIDTIFSERNLSFNRNGNENTLVKDVLSINWTKLNYILKYEDDDFSQMSQGKKAFVILTLILEFSQDKKPVIIDQPEDSLDNRSIYLELTKYLKSKKKDRQIILVTHNPNVVVGADTENVIVANQNSSKTPNKDGVQFSYINGSLENTLSDSHSKTTLESKSIREHVIEILEGGNDAFRERENKYMS